MLKIGTVNSGGEKGVRTFPTVGVRSIGISVFPFSDGTVSVDVFDADADIGKDLIARFTLKGPCDSIFLTADEVTT